MPTSVWIVIAIVIVLDLLFMPVVVRLLVAQAWNPIAEAHPRTAPAPDAVTRRRQGISVGLVNLGMCFTISVDEHALHLVPNALGRLLGLRPASIPWDAIEAKKRGRFFSRVRVAGRDLAAPRWCLDLAFVDEGGS